MSYKLKEKELLTWLKLKIETDNTYQKVLTAFFFAKQYHSGTRQGGNIPEFQHQIEIMLDLIPFEKFMKNPIEVFSTVLLHDVVEDYGMNDKIWEMNLSRLKIQSPVLLSDIADYFGKDTKKYVDNLSKSADGIKKGSRVYYRNIGECDVSSIVKLGDRKNNLENMLKVFPLDKQERYCKQIKEHFFKMLNKAEMLHPEQKEIYDYYREKFLNIMSFVEEKVIEKQKQTITLKIKV